MNGTIETTKGWADEKDYETKCSVLRDRVRFWRLADRIISRRGTAFERGRDRLDMPGNFADSPRANWLASVSARVTPNAHL